MNKDFDVALKDLILRAVLKIFKDGSIPSVDMAKEGIFIELEAPKDRTHGDISTNIALRLSKYAKKNPMQYVHILASRIDEEIKNSRISDRIKSVEVKNPGFVNFWLSDKSIIDILNLIIDKKDGYGRAALEKKGRVNIEFVSANPTGPLTIAHGRQAAFGDTLANILDFANIEVKREYYINDEGNQMMLLGASIRARYLELLCKDSSFPENGYKGSYVIDIARDIHKKYGSTLAEDGRIDFFVNYGCEWMLASIKRDLKDFNVNFDFWYSQKSLTETGKIDNALALLKTKGFIYENEGANWFRSTKFGDDKDRVVIKSTGEYTYLAPDIAYHRDKFDRGFTRLIDIWGPDHHGYIPRIKASVEAMGRSKDSLDVLIVQLCTLYKNGKAVQMSTRQGEFITLRDLIDEVGKDVARYFFLKRKRDSHLDFDLELAKKHSMDNPVYYIQYAYARISSIDSYYKKESGALNMESIDCALLKEPEEKAIIKTLGRFSDIIESCAKNLEAFPLVSYLEEVAGEFHSYYDSHRIVTDEPRLTEARLFLCIAIKIVIANGLNLLGVDNPESM